MLSTTYADTSNSDYKASNNMNINLGNRAARVIGRSIEINERSTGDKAYKVTTNDGARPMDFIFHAKSADDARRKAQLAITSTKGIYFSVVLSEFEINRPSDITPSQYIKPSDFRAIDYK